MRLNLVWCGALIGLGMIASGCDELDCLVSGDNVHGRIVFGANVPIQQGSNLVVQWSSDSFGGGAVSSATESNMHGLVTVPFGACVATNTDFQMRAFQDVNGNGTMDTGEARGLYDGTNGTNGSYITVRVNKDATTEKVTDAGPIDIAIDTP